MKHWRDWCDGIGTKLLDESISIDKVIGQFILPEKITSRPTGVLLAVEWPWQIYTRQADSLRLSYDGKTYEMAYTDLIPDTDSISGPFRFQIKTEAWIAEYEGSPGSGGVHYSASSDQEVMVVRAQSEMPLSDWLNQAGLIFTMDDDRIIEDNMLYKPTWTKDPFERSTLVALDWTGTRLNLESQGKERLEHSIQHRAIAELKREPAAWDVVLDDDGTGEIADVVAMRIDDKGLLVRFVHCKYAHGDAPGARVADLYEVCGQTQKSVRWRRSELAPFFTTLLDRARKKQTREGVSPFEVGDVKKLYEIRDKAVLLPRRMEMIIVQPGLSASKATTQQLDLLASTQEYLKTTIKAPLVVWCSP
ncbi:hypothetical protein ASH00_08955 [Arthrobacter sp. Soil782]|uniref:hypothetical protein n=1 Tax=Arthrobacter sp. Soil782 TaxID=1736410 RepID=UPI0007022DFB|nr:hypothetical protein [Arthrobacter sp. Soil782]KRF06358.1 hypothetical protein ASH00_08955 [Arthrobacter sp. Soil782]